MVPETSRAIAYNHFAGTWLSVAVQASGRVMTAHGESLKTARPLFVPSISGGVPLGSGLGTSGVVVERVIVYVPLQNCSGSLAVWGYSGEAQIGVYLGGKSNDAPWPGDGCIASGKGLFLPTGTQKELYVQALDEIYVTTDAATSGIPITFVAEGINVA